MKSALDLVNALAWPLVAVLALILFRRPLLQLLGAITRRTRKVAIYVIQQGMPVDGRCCREWH
jgi:hypothetical protein